MTARDPVLGFRLEAVETAGHRREGLEEIVGQCRNHHRKAGLAEGLGSGGADADPDAADPIGDPCPFAQERQDAGQIAGDRIGCVDEAEIGALGQRRQLIEAGFDETAPIAARGMGGVERNLSPAGHPLLADAAVPEIRRST